MRTDKKLAIENLERREVFASVAGVESLDFSCQIQSWQIPEERHWVGAPDEDNAKADVASERRLGQWVANYGNVPAVDHFFAGYSVGGDGIDPRDGDRPAGWVDAARPPQ